MQCMFGAKSAFFRDKLPLFHCCYIAHTLRNSYELKWYAPLEQRQGAPSVQDQIIHFRNLDCKHCVRLITVIRAIISIIIVFEWRHKHTEVK